ncbi:NAD-dependent epimerase/dehydratase family protein [Gracilinema caldarium]|uniref:UDP-glucuronate 4-epimerase n=1 Tax=Gracilinema caldarium (strain ATCC 51460 / DSM 7334 / H1) TaxID=744872 RepID=F8EXN2_GRAC1|nr:NAD-dependent epimerase/dehydratase family protein [Gracilinema caldarium]AEJ19613.1 UDP-glucuronate 4-epimerase [Gracilinema caldarium DSM 7334]
MSTYLITGAAGFIGFHLSKRLIEQGHTVIGLDNINDYYDITLKYARIAQLGIKKDEAEKYNQLVKSTKYHTFSFIRLNLEDYNNLIDIFNQYNFDCVINLAAQAGVRYSIDHPFSYVQSNLVGFLSILEACRHFKIPHLIYASSSSVYGMNSKYPFSEDDPVDHPVSLYAATKRANELMAHTYSHLYGFRTTGLRFFTVYGPWGRPDMAYFKFARSIMEEKPIEVYNNGDMYRDFTYIDDIIDGIVCVSNKNKENNELFKIYNIGNNNPEKLSKLITVLEESLGKKAQKIYLPMQPGDVYRTAADITALSRDCNWQPHTSLKTGIKSFAKWFLSFYNYVNL